MYPTNGIYRCCKNHIESCTNHLSRAISNCNFDIPSEFVYKSYLNNIDNIIRDYYREITSINSKILKINNTYETLSSDLELDKKKIIVSKIKDRDRMIL